LSYNYLNLPQSFVLPGGTTTMTYTADGEKLSKAAGATVKNYVSGIEFDNDITNLY
jgi:YD repeat-containing protein